MQHFTTAIRCHNIQPLRHDSRHHRFPWLQKMLSSQTWKPKTPGVESYRSCCVSVELKLFLCWNLGPTGHRTPCISAAPYEAASHLFPPLDITLSPSISSRICRDSLRGEVPKQRAILQLNLRKISVLLSHLDG